MHAKLPYSLLFVYSFGHVIFVCEYHTYINTKSTAIAQETRYKKYRCSKAKKMNFLLFIKSCHMQLKLFFFNVIFPTTTKMVIWRKIFDILVIFHNYITFSHLWSTLSLIIDHFYKLLHNILKINLINFMTFC